MTSYLYASGYGVRGGNDGQAGMYAPGAPGWTNAGFGPSANTAYFLRVVPSRQMTITSIAYGVTVAATVDDACDVGIYDATLTRLVSAGAAAGRMNSTGIKNIAITATTLAAGSAYYAAYSYGAIGGVVGQVSGGNYGALEKVQLFGATAGLIEACNKGSSHPLPAGPVASPAASSLVPVLALREA